MKLFKFFKKPQSAPSEITAIHPEPNKSKERDSFYQDLKAQEEDRAQKYVLGENDMSEEDRNRIAKSLVSVDPFKNAKIVYEGDDWEGDGLVAAQDATPAGSVFSKDDGRYADIWTTFARINPRILRHFTSRTFISYPACTLLGTHEFINPLCAMPGEDAMSPGYVLSCFSDEHKSGDEHLRAEDKWLKDMKFRADSIGMNKACTDMSFYSRLYGIGVAVPRVELKEGHSFEEPYDTKLIKPGSYHGMSIVDPQKFAWDYTSDTLYNPLSEYYMRPEFIRIFDEAGTRIHRSWLTVSIFKEVGDDLKATYMWGGVPLSQMLYERIFCADKLANECVALAMSKRTVVKDGNMKAMIAEPNKASHFIERWNGYRNNQSIAFKEAGEQITQLETSLSDLQPLSAQQYQWGCAIAGVPMTKMMKNVPSGLQATGQYEQDEYDQTLENIRHQIFLPLLTKHFEIDIASSYPDRDDLKVAISFLPLHSPKAAEIQQMANQKVSMISQLIQNSVISVSEARAMLRQDEENPMFTKIAIDTPEVLKNIEEMKDPKKQQEMQMGGMGGGMASGMGAGIGEAPGPDAQGNQQFDGNKDIFQQALNEVIGEENNNGESSNQEQGEEHTSSNESENGENSEPASEDMDTEKHEG